MDFNEELILLGSVLKWIILSLLIGCVTGLAASGFIVLLHHIIEYSNNYEYAFYALPLSFFIANLLSQFVFKQHVGTDVLIAAINKNFGKIQGSFVPTKVVNVILILATGGSAGKESPCAQIGAGLASVFANLFKVDDIDRRKMVLCGFCAGFACVFGAPIAGALFGIEVLAVGVIFYDVLLPAFVASITAYQISATLGVSFFYYPLTFVPSFEQNFFFTLLLGGIFFGLCSYTMVRVIEGSTAFVNGIPLWRPLKGFIGGLVLVGLTLLFSRDYLGLGLTLLERTIKGHPVVGYTFLLKALFTVLTLSISRSGSVITPILFIGATAGSFYADVMGVDRSTFAAIGFVSLLAGAANTPIACSILAIELFGASVAPYAAISCIISFVLSGHRSLYASQLLTVPKSKALQEGVGQEIKTLDKQRENGKLSASGWLMDLWRRFR